MLKVLFILSFLFSLLGAAPAAAQSPYQGEGPAPRDEEPGRPPVPGAVYDEAAGAWMMPPGLALEEPVVPENGAAEAGEADPNMQAVASAPDQFGYTYDTATYSWKDAVTGGKNTGLRGGGGITGAIPLPFTFNFYENAYSKVYISSYGYLTFTSGQNNAAQSRLLVPTPPNNIIAPYWGPVDLASSGTTAQVFYKSFGTAPNRYFVVQWNKVKSLSHTYTFEAILHENGNIDFQYNAMTYDQNSGMFCVTAGIEDARASDGLVSTSYCSSKSSKTAVRFTRPAASAKLLVFPYEFGSFTAAGKTSAFTVPVTNTGSVGTDRYDIEIIGGSWPVSFTNAATGAALTDTNGNGIVDTGPVAQKATFNIGVSIQAPSLLGVGASTRQILLLRSSKNTAKQKDITLSLAVPAPFAATYRLGDLGAVQLHYVEPGQQFVNEAAPRATYGSDMVTAESPSGNLMTAWYVGRCISNCARYVEEIKYTVYDRSGNKVKGISTLSSLSSATMSTYDRYPMIAAAPNGTFGVVWSRRSFGSSGTNYNIYFQRVSEAGALIGSPINVTKITTSGSIYLYDPSITATGDNRFVLAWQRNSGGINDIYRAVYSAAGAVVAAPKKLTADTTSSSDWNGNPAVTGLQGNNVILTFLNYAGSYSQKFLVMNSGGVVTRPAALLDGNYAELSDAVQLPTGEILIAWENWNLHYVLLDPTTYAQISSVHDFYTDDAAYVSVTTDSQGHGIFSFAEYNGGNTNKLYYAAIDHAGVVVTEPMIYAYDPLYISTSYNGGMITSHQMLASTEAVDLALSGSTPKLVAPGLTGTVPIVVNNLGLQSASTATLTVEIPAGLAVTGSNMPDVVCLESSCTWNLGAMDFLTNGVITLDVLLPDVDPGTAFNLNYTISSAEADGIPANNTRRITVIAATQGYTPYITK